MKTENKMRVLMSDDETPNFDGWKDAAYEEGIELVCRENWEDAQAELEENWDSFDFIILDGRGKLTMEGGIENAQHVIKPLQWLSEMKGKGRMIPATVYTAYLEKLQDIVTVNDIVVGIHDKGKVDFSDLCKYIVSFLQANPGYKLKAAYPELFELFTLGLLKDEYRGNIIDMLRFIRGEYNGNTTDVFRGIRPMLENTFYKLHAYDSSVVAEKYLKKGSVDIRPVIAYLAGNPRFDKVKWEMQYSSEQLVSNAMYSLLLMLNDTTSGEAMHHTNNKTNNYMVASAINALFAYLSWYLEFVKTHYIK